MERDDRELLLRRRREYDEDDVRVRPGRGSRPRTRIRPRHTDAVDAFVVGVDRGRYTCATAGGDPDGYVTAMRARELGRKSVVVGDRVALVGDTGGGPGTLARIVRIGDRTSVLRRTADDDDPAERVIVANADQLVIVCSLVDPPPRTGFVDRCLVAAYDAGITPLLCLTKADLPGSGSALAELLAYYADLELAHVVCHPDRPLTGLRQRLAPRLSVLVGHSGVGKSTLVNRLVPGAGRAVGGVSAIGKGRHTSTSAVVLRLPAGTADPSGVDGPDRSGGWIVDTPGVRSFGLAHVSADSLLHGFPDLAPGAAECPPGCDHSPGADRCALPGHVTAGHASPERLASYRRLLASRAGEPA